jgi:hypothetical protein
VCSTWRELNHVPLCLPSRLLNVGSFIEDPHLNLLCDTTVLSLDTPYTTLSHCWGGTCPIRLLKENVEQFQSNIDFIALPRTFQEAVIATRNLGIHYLWIDALCIIQDSDADWRHEASLMSQVYANAYVNLSAAISTNSEGGLFRQRDPESFRPCLIQATWDCYNKADLICYSNQWSRDIEQAPINKRAWVMQERILAPRIVHFGGERVYWECAMSTASEGYPDTTSRESARFRSFKKQLSALRNASRSAEKNHKIYGIWDRVVLRYTGCGLTRDTDKLAAISSIARVIHKHLGLCPQDYVSGLWRPEMLHGLMWRSLLRNGTTSIAESKVSSWSWASFNGIIETGYSTMESTTTVAELLEMDVEPVEDPFGNFRSARFRLRGPLCEVIAVENRGEHDRRSYTSIKLVVGDVTLEEGASFSLRWNDSASQEVMCQDSLFLFLVRTRKRQAVLANSSFYAEGGYECLLLKPKSLGSMRGEYYRVGHVKFWSKFPEKSFKFGAKRDGHSILDRHFRSFNIADQLYEDVDENFMYTITIA